MPGLSTSEFGIVLFILLLIVAAGKLPAWGEAMGAYWYRRGQSSKGGPKPSVPAPPKA
jgi:Sec-independent protein translocase protein TatA